MEGQYHIILEYRNIIDSKILKRLFESTYRNLDIFLPESIEVFSSSVYMKAVDGKDLLFTSTGFYYYTLSHLEEQHILTGIKSAIEIAKKLEIEGIGFNPNIVRLALGYFDSDSSFEQYFGEIARNLQRRLYMGGNVYYGSGTNEFGLLLGAENMQNRSEFLKVLRSLGTSKPANSLDDLLQRIEQSKFH